jgi:class 3 adenylate cyclase
MSDPASNLDPKTLLRLLDSVEQLSSHLSLGQVLTNMLAAAKDLTASTAGSVMLHDSDPGRDDLFLAAMTDHEDGTELPNVRFPLRSTAVGKVFLTGEATKQNEITASSQYSSTICVPLAYAGQPYGVMQVIDKDGGTGSYSDTDLIVIQRLASQAAIAVRNASLFERMAARSGLHGDKDVCADLMPHLTEGGVPARQEKLTVLFADLKGFTQLSNVASSPQLIHRSLHGFLQLLSERIVANKGIVNKFLGDRALAIFRGIDGPSRAVRASFEIFEGFETLKSTWQEQVAVDLGFLDVGVGVTTGEVILGTVGDEWFQDLTVVGLPVVLAASLERSARAGCQLLCDNPTYQAVRHIVAEFEGPVSHQLRSPEQPAGVKYPCYHIKQLKSHGPRPVVFLSYSSADQDQLVELFGDYTDSDRFELFFSAKSIEPGVNWSNEIAQALSTCNYFLVVVSANSAESHYVESEVTHAFSRPPLRDERRIQPLVIDDTSPGKVHWQLTGIQAIDLRAGEGRDQLGQLLERITQSAPFETGLDAGR